jgi:serine/threonine-protein kinase
MGIPGRLGRYEVELVLGNGDVGRTLLARDPWIGRQVAIKTLRDDRPLDARTAIADQVRAGAAFAHPAVATLLDMGEDSAIGPYWVFEFVRGPSLRETLASGPLKRSEVASIARSLGAALAQAHATGATHGNIKPENVILTANGPRLIDFGFAVPPGVERSTSSLATAAPEVVAGGGPSPATDQFSLAATLYEALTGRSRLSARDRAPVDAVAPRGIDPPTGLIPELRSCPHLDAIFARALSDSPEQRFAACDAFGAALAGSLEGGGPSWIDGPFSQRSIVPRATRRWQNAAAGAAVLVIATLLVVGQSPTGVSLKSVAAAFAAAAGSHSNRTPASYAARTSNATPSATPTSAPATATGSASATSEVRDSSGGPRGGAPP